MINNHKGIFKILSILIAKVALFFTFFILFQYPLNQVGGAKDGAMNRKVGTYSVLSSNCQ